MSKRHRNRRALSLNRVLPRVEALEPRLAPAFVMNPTTVVYKDIDGDDVTVRSSKPIFDAAHLDQVFIFNTPGGQQQLEEIDLTKLANPTAAKGTGLTIIATRNASTGGDGFVNVGFINAGVDLGIISIKGDLGRINAGDATTGTMGLASLTVQSLGRFGTTTQADLPTPNLVSNILGRLGTLTVKADVLGASLQVSGGTTAANGQIGTAIIGGSLVGTAGQANSGFVHATGAITSIIVNGDIVGGNTHDSGEILSDGRIGRISLQGSLLGGTDTNTGRVAAQSMGSVLIRGSLMGSSGQESGSVHSLVGGIGLITVSGSLIGGSNTNVSGGGGTPVIGAGSIGAQLNIGQVTVTGNLQGGVGEGSGSIISTNGLIESVLPGTATFVGATVGGSLIGGSGSSTGMIFSHGDLGPVRVGRDVRGGSGADSGEIVSATGLIRSASMGGALLGGAGGNSGEIDSSGALGPITIGSDVRGGSGAFSGAIFSGAGIAAVTINGSLLPGTVTNTGLVMSTTNLGPVRVLGDVRGGDVSSTGFISQGVPATTTGSFTSVFVGGSLIGGTADNTGFIQAKGALAQITVTGNVLGGSGNNSGAILGGAGGVGTLRIGGSLVGGSGNSTGVILSGGNLGPVTIIGNLVGGSISGNATVTLDQSGYIQGVHVVSVTVNGSIFAGSNTNTGTGSSLTRSGSIRASQDIVSILVSGSLVGNDSNPVIISAVGQAFLKPTARTNFAIGSLTVNGRVELANILAGYDPTTNGKLTNTTTLTGQATNGGQASIGTVRVTGDWVRSNLLAGVAPGAGRLNGNDTEIGGTDAPEDLIARIASILIGGQVLGTPLSVNATDFYGFAAEEIDAFTLGGTSIPLHTGPSNDGNPTPIFIGSTNDVILEEVP